MSSSPRPASEPLMISASATLAATPGRGQDSARASRPTGSRHGGPRAEQGRDDSPAASAASNRAKDVLFPSHLASDLPSRYQVSGQLQRGRVASCPPCFRSAPAAAAIKATALLSLQITGLRVKAQDPWRRCPKEDSENRARRYLVEVDECLGTRPRPAEDPQVRPLKRSNPISDARPARTPVAGQRDPRPHVLDRQIRNGDSASRPPSRPASASRLPARERRETRPLLRSKSTKATRSKRRKKDSPGDATPRRRPQRGSLPAPPAPPPDQAARERRSSDASTAFAPREPKALLRVTVRTTPAREHPRRRSDGAARAAVSPASGEQQERPGSPGRCAHVSGVRRESPPPSPPPRSTCRPPSPRSLQSLSGRSLGHRPPTPHAPRPAYIAPRSPLARQSLQQHLQGYTCFSSPEGISLLIQRCPTAPVDAPPPSCCDVPASGSHRLLQNIACQVSHLSAAGKLPL